MSNAYQYLLNDTGKICFGLFGTANVCLCIFGSFFDDFEMFCMCVDNLLNIAKQDIEGIVKIYKYAYYGLLNDRSNETLCSNDTLFEMHPIDCDFNAQNDGVIQPKIRLLSI